MSCFPEIQTGQFQHVKVIIFNIFCLDVDILNVNITTRYLPKSEEKTSRIRLSKCIEFLHINIVSKIL